jgi:hypothetical protein
MPKVPKFKDFVLAQKGLGPWNLPKHEEVAIYEVN